MNPVFLISILKGVKHEENNDYIVYFNNIFLF